jgi:hypothetical protein
LVTAKMGVHVRAPAGLRHVKLDGLRQAVGVGDGLRPAVVGLAGRVDSEAHALRKQAWGLSFRVGRDFARSWHDPELFGIAEIPAEIRGTWSVTSACPPCPPMTLSRRRKNSNEYGTAYRQVPIDLNQSGSATVCVKKITRCPSLIVCGPDRDRRVWTSGVNRF